MTAAGPLVGVRIIDLTMFVSGPVATMILADLGADVVKVEPVTGDPVRTNAVGPQIDGESAQFHSYNRNKRSLAVDLKDRRGLELVTALCVQADAVIDNFRPGVLSRFGLDHESLARTTPRLVSASISAFGDSGPWRDRPGFDLAIQALSGAMSLTGDAEAGPSHIPGHLADTASGMFAAVGTLAALNEAARTGVGRRVDVALLDSMLAMLGDEITHLGAGLASLPHGAGHPLLFPYEAFPTQDEPLVIAAVGVERFWPAMCDAIGRPDLGADPRFGDNAARVANASFLRAEISAVLRTRPRAEWLEVLAGADVPATPVNSLTDVVEHAQVEARDMIVDLERGDGGSARIAGNPVKIGGADERYDAAPRLGEHTDEILAEVLGLTADAVASLRGDGVVR